MLSFDSSLQVLLQKSQKSLNEITDELCPVTTSTFLKKPLNFNLEQNILYKSVETLRKSPKRTIYANSGLGLLQMILELDTGRYVSKEAEP